MQAAESYVNERLDHLGIVAGVCQEIGLASWLDEHDPTNRQVVSVGTATTAMILNGLGFSNRQLYLVPQYFANRPIEPLLGRGIPADMLTDDCLGRTLDWLYAHDPTKLFAGIAHRARQVFGISTKQVPVDTTSFSVSGEYAPKKKEGPEAEGTAGQLLLIARSSPSRTAIHAIIARTSNSGCWRWPPSMLAIFRSFCSRSMGTPATKGAYSPPSRRSRSNCVKALKHPVSTWPTLGCTVTRISHGLRNEMPL